MPECFSRASSDFFTVTQTTKNQKTEIENTPLLNLLFLSSYGMIYSRIKPKKAVGRMIA